MAIRKSSQEAQNQADVELPNSGKFLESLAQDGRLEEDRRQSDRGDKDRRKHERARIDTKASLRVRAGSGIEGMLDNLSAGGCSMQLPICPFNAGDVVWFKVDTIQPWMGTVRWVNDNKVGVEFDRPFHPAVFDRIVEMSKPVTCSRTA